MLTPLGEHQLLVFWLQLATLLVSARLLGYVARRFGLPAVVGELLAGLFLGPSVFGRLAPGAAAWLFPGGELQSSLLLAVAWLGVVLLLVVTGVEVELPLVRRLLRRAWLVPLGSTVLPLGLGVAVAAVLPAGFIGPAGDRPLFAGFVGVVLAVSALPLVARILLDMGLIRRDVGQLTVVSAMADDLVGWLLLGVLAGVAAEGGFDVPGLLIALAAVAVFLVGALTVGQRAVDVALRTSLRLSGGVAGAFTVTVVVALVAAAFTQWIGLEAVFGAFVAGLVLGRSPYRRREVHENLEMLSTAVLAPVFFATAGMFLDVAALAEPAAALWTLALLAVACLSKLAGASAGAALGRFDRATALAVGVGLNARGALGVVAATVALGLGVFSDTAYTALVLVSLVTSVLAAPLLRTILRRVPLGLDEAARLDREALLAESVTVSARRILLPTRGGAHSRVAARILDLVMPPGTAVTVLGLHAGAPAETEASVTDVAQFFGHRRVERSVRGAADPATAILSEVAYGYDLLAVGASGEVHHPQHFSATLRRILTESPVPVLLVRSGERPGLAFRRLLTAATGTSIGRAAEEVAYQLGAATGADVDVIHVVSRGDQMLSAVWSGDIESHPAARGLLGRSAELARRFDKVVSGFTRIGTSPYEELLGAAAERDADTIVVGAQVRDLDGRPFLGHGIEYLLQHAPQDLIVVAFPPVAARLTGRLPAVQPSSRS